MLVNRHGVIEYASASATHVFGRNPDDLVGASWFDLVLEKDRPMLANLLADTELGSHSDNVRLRSIRSNGTISHVATRVVNRLDDPTIGAFVCNCHDVTEGNVNETGLDESRVNFKAVFDNSSDLLCSLDTESRIVTYNSTMERVMLKMFGLKLEKGLRMWDVMPQDECAFWRGMESRVLAGECLMTERHYNYTSGEAIVEFTLYPICEGTSITGTCVIARNVTEERAISVAHARSEEEHRRFFYDAPLPMIVFDPTSLRILRVNRAVCELYQYSTDELLDLTVAVFRPAEDQEAFMKNIVPQIEQGDELTLQTVHEKKNGDRIDVEIRTHPTIFDGVSARIAMLKDITESLKSRTELAQARATLKSVLDSSQDAISAIDTEHHLVAHNKFLKDIMLQLFGIEVRNGIKLNELLPPEEAAFWHGVYTRALTGEAVTTERVYPTPFGDVTVAFSIFPIYDGDTITGASSFGKDITLQREAEEEQRKLFDESPMPMWVIDVETLRFLKFNRAVCDLYEYSESEFLGMTPLDLHSEADREHYALVTIPRILNLQDEKPFTVQHGKKSGVIIDVFLQNHLIQFGGRTARMVLAEDITQRLVAKKALLKASERFRLATEAVNSVIYDWDVVSGLSSNTAGLIPLLGFDPDNERGFDTIEWWNSRIHPDDRTVTLEAIDHALTGENAFEVEYRMCHKLGHYVYVWDRGIISRDEHGTATRVVGSAQDITSRKRMEAHLVEERNKALTAKESAEEMNRLKTNFLANMSHEIRTPMTAILGFAEILADGIVDPVTKRHATIIHSSANRLLETINSILDLARTESQKVKLSPSRVDLNQEIQRLVILLEPLASQRNVDLRFVPSSQPSEAFLDVHYLSQITTNLISNALKFTEDGQIDVHLQIGPDTLLPIPLIAGFTSYCTAKHPEGEHLRVVVTDTGIGIARENLALIFDEFKQESTGYHRSHEGTGLGLTISNRLVSAMGGSIEVRSAQGVGSTFIVRLPRVVQQQGLGSPSSAMGGAPIPEEKETKPAILLVEDATETAEMIAYMMGPDHEVQHVTNAEAARIALDQLQPHLILMDLNLGSGMSGLELTSILRQEENTSSIPIIALSAYARPSDRKTALDAGCDDYLTKPFTKEQLLEMVARNLLKDVAQQHV